jgi:uncharacterized protein (TIGR00290 family)
MLGQPGTYLSAGAETAKSGANPALSRNCNAPSRGRARSTALHRTNVSPRRKGGSGGTSRRASSSADAEVSLSGHTIDSRPGRSQRFAQRAALAERPTGAFALSWSGGKDSALALWTLRRQHLEPEALLTTITETYDRISMHGVRRELLARQAEALGVPLVEVMIPPGCVNEIYEERMADAFASASLRSVEAVVFGDLFLEDVRAYREGQLAAAGRHGSFPLWGRDTAALAHEFLDAGFEATLVCVDPRQLDPTFCGRPYDKTLLGALPPRVDPCGENGEFHTFVSAGPIFSSLIACERGEIVERDGFIFCDLTSAPAG